MGTEAISSDRDARIALAAISEPADIITGTLVSRIGAVETLSLLNTRMPMPTGIDSAEGELWRQRIAARLTPDRVDRIQADMHRLGLQLLTPDDAGWPAELRQLGAGTPLALWMNGEPALLSAALSRRVAIVGARAATAYGIDIATNLAADLVERGRVIVSGGSYGIDAAAHQGANETALGHTIAVLASGLDRPYPSAHAELFSRIAKTGGLLVSELPPDAKPTKWRLLQRARLLAALSSATVVVEAGHRSTALNVASLARALGRPVAAIPGPLTSPASAGSHRLIQDGTAALIANADDVVALVEPTIMFGSNRSRTFSPIRQRTRPAPYLIR